MAAKIALFWNDTHTNFFHIFCENRTFFFIYLKSWFWIYENSSFFRIWIFYFRKNKMKAGFDCEKNRFLVRNTETAGQNYFFVNDKNSWNSAKTALFSGSEFFYFQKYSESRFWMLVWATKIAVSSAYMNFVFQKK